MKGNQKYMYLEEKDHLPGIYKVGFFLDDTNDNFKTESIHETRALAIKRCKKLNNTDKDICGIVSAEQNLKELLEKDPDQLKRNDLINLLQIIYKVGHNKAQRILDKALENEQL